MLSNVTDFKEILNSPETHVHHGFEGKRKTGRTLKKQIVVQS